MAEMALSGQEGVGTACASLYCSHAKKIRDLDELE